MPQAITTSLSRTALIDGSRAVVSIIRIRSAPGRLDLSFPGSASTQAKSCAAWSRELGGATCTMGMVSQSDYACHANGNGCDNVRTVLQLQPSLRLQYHRNAVPNLFPLGPNRHIAICPKYILPKVGLEPRRVLPHRILSPARLPSPWYWKQVAVVLKVCESKARTSPPWCFRIVAAWG